MGCEKSCIGLLILCVVLTTSVSGQVWSPQIDLSTGVAVDPNRPGILPWRSGISLQSNGVEDTDWAEELHFYDNKYQPRGLLFINTKKSDGNDQKLRLVHNEYNIMNTDSGSRVLKDVLGEYNLGKIRGVFDQFFIMRDMSDRDTHYPANAWKTTFYDDSTKSITEINLATFLQADGTVMWSGTGYTSVANPGQEGAHGFGKNTGTWTDYYHPVDQYNTWYRGLRVWGDSYVHWLSVWDDDSYFNDQASNLGRKGSDGKMFALVINPKVPAVKLSSVGNAKWRFDRVTYYGMPKFVEDQSIEVSYSGPTGDVNIRLVNVVQGATQIQYSTDDGTTWENYGAPLSTRALFGISGTHDLWVKVNTQNVIRKLKIMVNPESPSKDEPKDKILIRDDARKMQLINNLKASPKWVSRKTDSTSIGTKVPGLGLRYGEDEFGSQGRAAFASAMISWVDGYETQSLYYNEAVKRLLHYGGLDPVGNDGENNGWWNPIPTNEISYETYRDKQFYPAPLAYVLLASDNHMDVVEEYEIRDNLASVAWSMMIYSNSIQLRYCCGSDLHIRAHDQVVALATMLAMPSYSHPIFGDATGQSDKYIFWDESVKATNDFWQSVTCTPEAGSWEYNLLGIIGEDRGVWPCQMRHGGSMYGVAQGGNYGEIPEGNDRPGYELELFHQLEEISVLLIRNGYWEKYSTNLNANMGEYLGGRATGDYDDHYLVDMPNKYPLEGKDVFSVRQGGTNRLLNPEAQRGSEWWHDPAPGNLAIHPDNLALWLKQTAGYEVEWDSFVPQYYDGRSYDWLSVFFAEPENLVDCAQISSCGDYSDAVCGADPCDWGCSYDGLSCVSKTIECTDNSNCIDSNSCTYDLCKDSVCINNNANLDGSATIGLGDIIQVMAHWATTGPTGDIDLNGNVGLSDIIAIIGLWANTC
ncbi:MAG: hypothetical protein JXB14_07405 [Candidatus Altiarchaeota archaeon]|nr:hypothetical protein [Candidatus Altiarchaeota archaeon]